MTLKQFIEQRLLTFTLPAWCWYIVLFFVVIS